MDLTYQTIRTGKTVSARRGVLKLSAIFLWLAVGLLILLLSLPVVLLPLATGVPLWLALILGLTDIAVIVTVMRFQPGSLVKGLALSGGFVTVAAIAVWLSQAMAYTPPIVDSNGDPLPGSIAVMEQVDLNGSQQWITIRGKNADAPVLLFLSGGPGGSQLTTARHALQRLEDHFVVVNWEQPGAGKSFNAVNRSTLTPERYITDGYALVQHLRERFGQEKVYVLGESWGSALGIMLVQRYPDLFQAFIGTAQMVAFLETDLICYDFAINWAQDQGDTQKVAQLKEQGPPPYYGEGVVWKQVNYLKDTYTYMNQNPRIISGFNTPRDLASPEYGLIDKVNWARGPLDTLGIVYPQLWDIDFREQAPRLDVPVYFLIGRHDVNAPPALVEAYYAQLDAPHKELIWFERSGHSPWMGESGKFVDVMVNTVLSQTQSLTHEKP